MSSESHTLAAVVVIGITVLVSMFVFTCHKPKAKLPAWNDSALMKEFLGK